MIIEIFLLIAVAGTHWYLKDKQKTLQATGVLFFLWLFFQVGIYLLFLFFGETQIVDYFVYIVVYVTLPIILTVSLSYTYGLKHDQNPSILALFHATKSWFPFKSLLLFIVLMHLPFLLLLEKFNGIEAVFMSALLSIFYGLTGIAGSIYSTTVIRSSSQSSNKKRGGWISLGIYLLITVMAIIGTIFFLKSISAYANSFIY